MRELLVMPIAALAISCQVQGQCESTPAFVEYCGPNDSSCQGHVVNANTWESGPETGSFLPFGAEQTYHLHYRDAVTGQELSGKIQNLLIRVGATQQPDAPGSVWIPCADQLCEVNDSDPTALWVKNDTCQGYFFQVIVTFVPNTSADAGTE